MIILDTNIILAFLFEEDSQHKKARDMLQKYQNQNFIIPKEIWQETINVVANRRGSDAAILVDETLQKFVSYQDFNVSDSQIWKHIFIKIPDHHLSFVDCLLIYLSQKEKLTVLSFDQELNKHISNTKN